MDKGHVTDTEPPGPWKQTVTPPIHASFTLRASPALTSLNLYFILFDAALNKSVLLTPFFTSVQKQGWFLDTALWCNLLRLFISSSMFLLFLLTSMKTFTSSTVPCSSGTPRAPHPPPSCPCHLTVPAGASVQCWVGPQNKPLRLGREQRDLRWSVCPRL